MKTQNYVVKFYKKAEKTGERDQFLGEVEVDTTGLTEQFTVTAKAFRQAPPRCLFADLVQVYRK